MSSEFTHATHKQQEHLFSPSWRSLSPPFARLTDVQLKQDDTFVHLVHHLCASVRVRPRCSRFSATYKVPRDKLIFFGGVQERKIRSSKRYPQCYLRANSTGDGPGSIRFHSTFDLDGIKIKGQKIT